MRVLWLVCFIVCADATRAGTISGQIALKGGRPGSVKAGYVGVVSRGQTVHNSAGMTIGTFKTEVVSTTFRPRNTRVVWDPARGCRFEHTALPPGRYLVWVRCDDHYMDWRMVTLDGAQQSVAAPLAWSKTRQGDMKLVVSDRSASYNVRLSPLKPDGKSPLPEADVPMYAGWDLDVMGGSLVLTGMKPGEYQVELRRQQKHADADGGWSAILHDAGRWSARIVGGKLRTYQLR